MNIREALNDYLVDLPEDQLGSLTIGGVIDVVHSIYRKAIYQKHPTADPKVVEALLLLQKHLTEQIFCEIDGFTLSTPIIEPSDTSTELLNTYSKFGEQFGAALKKTLDTLTK